MAPWGAPWCRHWAAPVGGHGGTWLGGPTPSTPQHQRLALGKGLPCPAWLAKDIGVGAGGAGVMLVSDGRRFNRPLDGISSIYPYFGTFLVVRYLDSHWS